MFKDEKVEAGVCLRVVKVEQGCVDGILVEEGVCLRV